MRWGSGEAEIVRRGSTFRVAWKGFLGEYSCVGFVGTVGFD